MTKRLIILLVCLLVAAGAVAVYFTVAGQMGTFAYRYQNQRVLEATKPTPTPTPTPTIPFLDGSYCWQVEPGSAADQFSELKFYSSRTYTQSLGRLNYCHQSGKFEYGGGSEITLIPDATGCEDYRKYYQATYNAAQNTITAGGHIHRYSSDGQCPQM